MRALSGWTSHKDTFISDQYPSANRPWLDEEWFLKQGIDGGPFNATGALIEQHVAGPNADHLALIGSSETWSFRDLASRVNRCTTTVVRGLGVKPGSAVILQCTNSPWHVAVLLGLWRAGCVAVMCSPLLTEAEVSELRHLTAAKAWISDAASVHAARSDVMRLDDFVLWASSWDSTDTRDDRVATAPTDPALILFTSGSTGKPKATLHLHRDLVVAPLTYGKSIVNLGPGAIVAGSPSLCFAYGLETLLLMPLFAGAASIMKSDMAAAQILSTIRSRPVTHVFTTPAIISAMLDAKLDTSYARLSLCVSAGENMTADLMTKWWNLTGVPLVSGLGLTELNAFVLGSAPGRAPNGSLGHAVEGFHAKLLDDAGIDSECGAIGRLAVRGPTGCRYFRDPEEQASRVIDGWTLTGDLCERDVNGVFWYRGRCDCLIVRGGINIAPIEVEQVLLKSALVKECVVIDRFNDCLQTRMILAYIVLKNKMSPDAARHELRQWTTRLLPPHKMPDAFVLVDELPRNRNGKLNRLGLREQGYDAIL